MQDHAACGPNAQRTPYLSQVQEELKLASVSKQSQVADEQKEVLLPLLLRFNANSG